MIWSLIQQAGGQSASLLIFAVLVAVLNPRDVGLLATGTVWINVLAAFTEMGVGAALVQRARIEPGHLSTTFAINIVVGIALTVLGVLLSWPAAIFFHSAAVQPVMAVLSLSFLIRAFGVTQSALAQRELNFRALAIRDLAATLVSGVVGIAMALGGFGVWSLVAMTLLGAVLDVSLLWRLTSWRPCVSEISIVHARDLWPYSSRMLGFNLFKSVVQNSDRIVLGHLLGPTPLGVYAFANRLLGSPVKAVVAGTDSYMFPKASHLQANTGAVRRLYVRVWGASMSIVVPAMLVASLLASVVIEPIFGSKWLPAVSIIPIVAAVVALQASISPVGQLMKAMGRPGWLLAWSVSFMIVTVAAMWIGGHHGLFGATLGLALAYATGFPVAMWIAWHLVRVRVWELGRQVLPTLVASAAAGLAMAGLLSVADVPALLRASLVVIAGGAVYLPLLAWLDPVLAHDVGQRVIRPLRRMASL